jgi:hypothetical protein
MMYRALVVRYRLILFNGEIMPKLNDFGQAA